MSDVSGAGAVAGARWRLATLAVLVSVAALGGCMPDASEPFAALPPTFAVERLGAIFNVDDAGVGDFDGDGRLDLWTTNHSARQWIALARADGSFRLDAVASLGLHQDTRLPGIEPTLTTPECDGEHQIYLRGNDLFLTAGTAVAGPLSGELYLPWPAAIDTRGGAAWTPLDCPPGLAACTRGRFTAPAQASLRARMIPPRSDGFPIAVTLADAVPLTSIGVGNDCVRPPAHAIVFELKDRHGLLLTDLTGDGHADLFISRGGARGRLEQVNPGATDELWLGSGDDWGAADSRQSGLVKQGCPGRQVGAVDFDGDGDLDIYQVCGRTEGVNAASRNRLYIQQAPGRFEEQGERWGVALDGVGSFAWIPTGHALGGPLLVWATPAGVTLLAPAGDRYRPIWRQPRRGTEDDALLVGSPQPDGSIAIALVGKAGNTLLTLRPPLQPADPMAAGPPVATLQSFTELGLPAASSSGNWVDLAGVGRDGLFLVPQGLFKTTANGSWEPTGQFSLRNPAVLAAHSSWFDADNDGDLDLWLLLKDERLAARPLRWPLRILSGAAAHWYTRAVEALWGPLSWQPHVWQALLVRNQSSIVTHLAVTATGNAGNADGIGAAVTVTGTAGKAAKETANETERVAGTPGRIRRSIISAPNGARLSQTLHTVYIGIAGLEGEALIAESHADGRQRRYRLPLRPTFAASAAETAVAAQPQPMTAATLLPASPASPR